MPSFRCSDGGVDRGPQPVDTEGPWVEKFPITPETFFEITERKDMDQLEQLGGIEGVLEKLHTNRDTGIPRDDVKEHRTMRYGENQLPQSKKITFLQLLWKATFDKIIILLIICGIVSLIFGLTFDDPATGKTRETGWVSGLAIFIIVLIVVFVAAISDWQKARKFRQLSRENAQTMVHVVRAGEALTIDSADVLVGDLITVNGGELICVDCLLVHSSGLSVDESSATGESDHVKKSLQTDPFLLSGTHATEGEGKGIVIGVGVHSFAGTLQMATRKDPSDTPLQEKLNKLADRVGKAGISAAILTFVIQVITYVIRTQTADPKQPIVGIRFLDFAVTCVAVVVVSIPESLPLAVTISLGYAMKSVLKEKCLVRVMKSCETMGACTMICSDKTGTLTTNQMTVVQGWIGGEDFVMPGYGVENPGATDPTTNGSGFTLSRVPIEYTQLVCRAMSVNSTAKRVQSEQTGEWIWVGNKTEEGLLRWVDTIHNHKEFRTAIPAEDRHVFPFNSSRKRMTTIVREDNQWIVFVKGAPEMVLEDCESWLDSNSTVTPIDAAQREKFLQTISQIADQGNRTLAIAYAQIPAQPKYPETEVSPPLTLIALMGIQDPIRPEVPDAVAACQRAGIIVRMVTGDNIHTAMAIAKKCGIYDESVGVAMEGKEFREEAGRDPHGLRAMLPRLQILARSTPTDKHILVTVLKEQRINVVAVTGDGTNDAPALSLADVGFAMKAGTDIAKGASDMILMDNNFATVVQAIKWGRAVNDNIRKFLQYVITTNVNGVLIVLVGVTIAPDAASPFNAIQLLWMNMLMGPLAALAIATEKPSKTCLKRPPVYRDSPLFRRSMICYIVGHAAFQLALLLVLILRAHVWFQLPPCEPDDNGFILGRTVDGHCSMGKRHRAILFNVLVWLKIINIFNARKLYNELNPFSGILSRSIYILFVIPLMGGVQAIGMEFLGVIFITERLVWWEWLITLGISLLALPVGLIVRVISRFLPEYEPNLAVEYSSQPISGIGSDQPPQPEIENQMQIGNQNDNPMPNYPVAGPSQSYQSPQEVQQQFAVRGTPISTRTTGRAEGLRGLTSPLSIIRGTPASAVSAPAAPGGTYRPGGSVSASGFELPGVLQTPRTMPSRLRSGLTRARMMGSGAAGGQRSMDESFESMPLSSNEMTPLSGPMPPV